MAIKYLTRQDRINSKYFVTAISQAVFGTQEDIDFLEKFVPLQGRAPGDKVKNFAAFLMAGPNHLWAIFSKNENHNLKNVIGFILIGNIPEHNSIGFGIKKQYSRNGIMTKAWDEIRTSQEWIQIDLPLFGSTSQRNNAANNFLTKCGFQLMGNTNYLGEPSNRYQYGNP